MEKRTNSLIIFVIGLGLSAVMYMIAFHEEREERQKLEIEIRVLKAQLNEIRRERSRD